MNRIKVMDVELSDPVMDITGLDGYDGLQALVRMHGQPLGYVTIPVVADIVPARALVEAIEAAHGDSMRSRPAPEPRPGPRALPAVTVAVCTRDNPDELKRCLGALAHVEYPALDVLVVDNAPRTGATRQLVQSRYPAFRYVREPRPGLNWARNRAIAEASGEILAYTDDDVVVDPDWVGALAAVFAGDPEVAAVTGLVVPLELETPAQIHFERYGGFGCGFDRRRYSWADGTPPPYRGQVTECGTGANMAFRRDVFARIGTFDPAMDVGTVTTGGGDVEMFFRVLKEGLTLVYEPSAVVRHRHRPDHARLRAQITSWGTGTMAVFARSARHYPDERGRLVRLAIRGVARQLRRIVASWVHPPGFPRGLLLDELRGAATGLRRYGQARRDADVIARSFERAGQEPDAT